MQAIKKRKLEYFYFINNFMNILQREFPGICSHCVNNILTEKSREIIWNEDTTTS